MVNYQCIDFPFHHNFCPVQQSGATRSRVPEWMIGVGIGSTYANGAIAPTNGLIIQGNTGIGTTAPTVQLHVSLTGFSTTGVRITVNAGAVEGNANAFLIEDNAGNNLFRISASGTAFSDGSYNCGQAAECFVSNKPADLAELTAVVGNASDYKVGDIVRQSTIDPGKVEKTNKGYDPGLYGVVTDRGQFLGSSPDLKEDINAVKVALVGYVKARVSAKNGSIEPGDWLTARTKPGIAMKAQKPGRVIGIARESFDGLSTGSYDNRAGQYRHH